MSRNWKLQTQNPCIKSLQTKKIISINVSIYVYQKFEKSTKKLWHDDFRLQPKWILDGSLITKLTKNIPFIIFPATFTYHFPCNIHVSFFRSRSKMIKPVKCVCKWVSVICDLIESSALYNCHPHFAFPIHLLSPTIVVHQSFTIVIQFLFYLQM